MQSENELMEIGMGLIDTGKYEKAIEYFSKIISANPQSSTAYEYRGISCFKTYRVAEALQDLEKAIAINPGNHNAWYNKAEIHAAKKEFTAAEEAFLKANALYPGSFTYLTGLAQMCLKLKKPGQTIEYCNEILTVLPTDRQALWFRASAYSNQKEYPLAIKDILKILESGRGTAATYNNLGFYYIKTGDLRKAENNLLVALQLNPSHPYALDNLGHVYFLQNKYGQALEHINESLAIDPSNSYGYKNRALVYLSQQKWEEARQDLFKAKALGYAEEYDDEVEQLINKYGTT